MSIGGAKTGIGWFDEGEVVVDFGVFLKRNYKGKVSKMSLVGGNGKGILTEDKFEFFDGCVVRDHYWGGHGCHFMWLDVDLAGNSIKLVDGDAHVGRDKRGFTGKGR